MWRAVFSGVPDWKEIEKESPAEFRGVIKHVSVLPQISEAMRIFWLCVASASPASHYMPYEEEDIDEMWKLFLTTDSYTVYLRMNQFPMIASLIRQYNVPLPNFLKTAFLYLVNCSQEPFLSTPTLPEQPPQEETGIC